MGKISRVMTAGAVNRNPRVNHTHCLRPRDLAKKAQA
jgi:hypothetical protein